MKFTIPIKMYAVSNNKHTLQLIAKIDYMNLMRHVNDEIDLTKFDQINVNIVNAVTKKSSITTSSKKMTKLEQEMLAEVWNDDSSSLPLFLITIRSIVSMNKVTTTSNGNITSRGGLQGGAPKLKIAAHTNKQIRILKQQDVEHRIHSNKLADFFAKWLSDNGAECKREYLLPNKTNKYKKQCRVDLMIFNDGKPALIIAAKNYRKQDMPRKKLKRIDDYKQFGLPIVILSNIRVMRAVMNNVIDYFDSGKMGKYFLFDGKHDVNEILSKNEKLDKYRKLNDADKNKTLTDEQIKTLAGTRNGKFLKVSRWNSNNFHKYMAMKFKKAYGTDSFELMGSNGNDDYKRKTGMVWSIIKNTLIDKFDKYGLTKNDLQDYIDWVYDVKSVKINFPITLTFIKSPSLITEWNTLKNMKVKPLSNKKQSFREQIRGK